MGWVLVEFRFEVVVVILFVDSGEMLGRFSVFRIGRGFLGMMSVF